MQAVLRPIIKISPIAAIPLRPMIMVDPSDEDLLIRILRAPNGDAEMISRRLARHRELYQSVAILTHNEQVGFLISQAFAGYQSLYRAGLFAEGLLLGLTHVINLVQLDSDRIRTAHPVLLTSPQADGLRRAEQEIGDAMDLIGLLGNWRGALFDASA